MHLEKQFDVESPRDAAVAVVSQEDTLLKLFPEAESEIVEREGDRRTVRTYYRALGRDGTATFHFTFLLDGDVRFEKVCDGNVWKKLAGSVTLRERGGSTRVRIEMEGRTKGLVPEFTIKAPMQSQMNDMVRALRRRIEEGA